MIYCVCISFIRLWKKTTEGIIFRIQNFWKKKIQYWKLLSGGPVRESNPGPLAPKARIMPLDQQATHIMHVRLNSGKFWCYDTCWMDVFYFYFTFISKSVWSHQFVNIFHFFFVLQWVGSHSDSFNYWNRIFEVRHQCSAAQPEWLSLTQERIGFHSSPVRP